MANRKRRGERERAEKKRKKKTLFSVVRKAIFLIVLAAVVFFTANDHIFHIDGIPTSYEIVRFFGGGAKPYVELTEGEASVSYIDVGQGDCELIVTGDCSVLIDCGDDDNIYSVIGFLKYSGIDKLDMVIVSHQHADHMGGMYRILKEFDVGKLVMPRFPETGDIDEDAYSEMMYVIDSKGIPYEYAEAGSTYLLGDDTLEILAPIYDDYGNINNCSIVARFTHGENSFLFTGDLEREGELDILDSGKDIHANVLKVGHHGSDGSSSAEFLAEVSPKAAVIEVGANNEYGHPRTSVLERLDQVGCSDIYTTMNNGNIVIVSNGSTLKVYGEKGDPFKVW